MHSKQTTSFYILLFGGLNLRNKKKLNYKLNKDLFKIIIYFINLIKFLEQMFIRVLVNLKLDSYFSELVL